MSTAPTVRCGQAEPRYQRTECGRFGLEQLIRHAITPEELLEEKRRKKERKRVRFSCKVLEFTKFHLFAGESAEIAHRPLQGKKRRLVLCQCLHGDSNSVENIHRNEVPE